MAAINPVSDSEAPTSVYTPATFSPEIYSYKEQVSDLVSQGKNEEAGALLQKLERSGILSTNSMSDTEKEIFQNYNKEFSNAKESIDDSEEIETNNSNIIQNESSLDSNNSDSNNSINESINDSEFDESSVGNIEQENPVSEQTDSSDAIHTQPQQTVVSTTKIEEEEKIETSTETQTDFSIVDTQTKSIEEEIPDSEQIMDSEEENNVISEEEKNEEKQKEEQKEIETPKEEKEISEEAGISSESENIEEDIPKNLWDEIKKGTTRTELEKYWSSDIVVAAKMIFRYMDENGNIDIVTALDRGIDPITIAMFTNQTSSELLNAANEIREKRKQQQTQEIILDKSRMMVEKYISTNSEGQKSVDLIEAVKAIKRGELTRQDLLNLGIPPDSIFQAERELGTHGAEVSALLAEEQTQEFLLNKETELEKLKHSATEAEKIALLTQEAQEEQKEKLKHSATVAELEGLLHQELTDKGLIKLQSGEIINQSDFNALPVVARQQVYSKGLSALELDTESPKLQFEKMQELGFIPNNATFEGISEDGNIQYSAPTEIPEIPKVSTLLRDGTETPSFPGSNYTLYHLNNRVYKLAVRDGIPIVTDETEIVQLGKQIIKIGIGLIPVVGTAHLWNEMSGFWKIVSVAGDVAFFAKPIVTGIRSLALSTKGLVTYREIRPIILQTIKSIPETLNPSIKIIETSIKEGTLAKILPTIKGSKGFVTGDVRFQPVLTGLKTTQKQLAAIIPKLVKAEKNVNKFVSNNTINSPKGLQALHKLEILEETFRVQYSNVTKAVNSWNNEIIRAFAKNKIADDLVKNWEISGVSPLERLATLQKAGLSTSDAFFLKNLIITDAQFLHSYANMQFQITHAVQKAIGKLPSITKQFKLTQMTKWSDYLDTAGLTPAKLLQVEKYIKKLKELETIPFSRMTEAQLKNWIKEAEKTLASLPKNVIDPIERLIRERLIQQIDDIQSFLAKNLGGGKIPVLPGGETVKPSSGLIKEFPELAGQTGGLSMISPPKIVSQSPKLSPAISPSISSKEIPIVSQSPKLSPAISPSISSKEIPIEPSEIITSDIPEIQSQPDSEIVSESQIESQPKISPEIETESISKQQELVNISTQTEPQITTPANDIVPKQKSFIQEQIQPQITPEIQPETQTAPKLQIKAINIPTVSPKAHPGTDLIPKTFDRPLISPKPRIALTETKEAKPFRITEREFKSFAAGLIQTHPQAIERNKAPYIRAISSDGKIAIIQWGLDIFIMKIA